MKKKYLYQILAIAMLMFVAQSCFQDLDNDPPFNFPQEPPPPPAPEPPADGLLFRMSFDGNFVEAQSEIAATVVGSPTFTEGVEGQAFAGADGGYLTFDMNDLVYQPGSDFSVAFWYNVNGDPNRAGIFTITPGSPNTRAHGVRIFREGSAERQVVIAALGRGEADQHLNGGDAAALNPEIAGWVHVALTITNGRAALYFDGEPVSVNDGFSGISWEGCNIISIGSGGPGFSEWNHLSDQSLIDELFIYNRVLSVEEIAALMGVNPPLEMEGQVFYAPFNRNFRDMEGGINPTIEGTPTLSTGRVGQAFAGAEYSYLTFDVEDLIESLDNELTVTFWYNLNSTPDRAGIFTFAAANNDRTKGFRMFREGGAASQNMSIIVGTGGADVGVWGVPMPIDEWVHIALVIDAESITVYLDGEETRRVGEPYFTGGADFTGSTIASVGSGAPYFVEWNHLSDLSLIDELRIFNRALSAAEIATIIEHGN